MDHGHAPVIGVGRRGRLPWSLIAALPAAFLGVFYAWPVAAIVGRGLAAGPVLEVLTDRLTWQVAWFTLWQAAASTALTLTLGLPGAWVLARYRFPGRDLLRALVTVPFVLPTVVVATAFLGLLGRGGPLAGLGLHHSIWAILAAHVFFNYAVVVRTVGNLALHLDPDVEDAARTLGASRWRTFREVTLPRLRPAVASAAAIIFLFTFTSFGVVLILGGPRRRTLEVEIWRQTAQLLRLDVAAVLALLQLAAVVAALAAYARASSPGAGASRWGERLRPAAEATRRPAGRQRWMLAANLAVMAALLGAPVATLVWRSVDVAGGVGLGFYRQLGERSARSGLLVPPLEAIGNSLLFAAVTTALALTLGGLAATAVAWRRTGPARAFDTLLMLPLGTSAVTVGFGFLISLGALPVDLRASAALIPIAHTLIAVPFVVRSLVPVLRSVDPRLREAAAVLGASPLRARREVDLPMASRAALVGAGFAFAVSLGEFGATLFIVRPDTPTLPVAIFRLLSQPGAANLGQAMAMSTILMAVTATAVLAIDRFRAGPVGEF